MRKLRGLFILVRFELPFTAGICVIIGELLARNVMPDLRTLLLGFGAVFLISAAALILNDVFDVESDRINAPHRPIPAGMVSVRDVVIFSTLVTLSGFLLAYLIGPGALLVAILVWIVGFLYNWRFKKLGLAGNLMVSFSVGMTFIFGGIAVGHPFAVPVWFFALWTFFINLGEEIASDAMDEEGDRAAGSRSLAVIYGQKRALRVSAVIFSFVIAASSLPFILGWLALAFLPPILFSDLVTLISTVQLLNPKTPDRRKRIRWIYLGGLVALLGFLIIHLIRAYA